MQVCERGRECGSGVSSECGWRVSGCECVRRRAERGL